MSEELARYEGEDLVVTRDPQDVIAEARKAAQAVIQVIQNKPKPVKINGEQYFELEDWSMLARFYGLTAKITETKPVNFGPVRGWEAHAIVVDRKGVEVGAADGMCLNDEEKWSTKPKYEYHYLLKDGTTQKENPPKAKIVWIDNPKTGRKMPQTKKVKVGDEQVPFFQLRSMAQTRACSKALRQVLSWVVVLVGLKPTAMDEQNVPENDEEPPADERAQDEKPAESGITDEQKNNILYQLKKKNLGTEDLELATGRKMSEYQGIKDVNAALEWIGKQKGN